jgi:histone H3/H4
MPRQINLIPELPLKRIIKKINDLRISKKASSKLNIYINNKARDISKTAGKIAHHRKSNTINKGDIKLATGR